MDWIDLLVVDTEDQLQTAIASLGEQQLAHITAQLLTVLSIEQLALTKQLLRILLERARPLAVPGTVWRRSLVDSAPVTPLVKQHIDALGLTATPERVRGLVRLASEFREDRKQLCIDESLLAKTNFRCAVCGYPFSNEDLESYGIASLHGSRKVVSDKFKPSSQESKRRLPRVDHAWPISLFGSNAGKNLFAVCDSCNAGKQNFVTTAHSRSNVGHQQRSTVRDSAITLELFFSVVSRDRRCTLCGSGPHETELTIRPRDAKVPAVADNLNTVCYDCIEPVEDIVATPIN